MNRCTESNSAVADLISIDNVQTKRFSCDFDSVVSFGLHQFFHCSDEMNRKWRSPLFSQIRYDTSSPSHVFVMSRHESDGVKCHAPSSLILWSSFLFRIFYTLVFPLLQNSELPQQCTSSRRNLGHWKGLRGIDQFRFPRKGGHLSPRKWYHQILLSWKRTSKAWYKRILAIATILESFSSIAWFSCSILLQFFL